MTDITCLPDRLNGEPVVFLGLTDSELKMLSVLSLLVWMPTGLLIAGALGQVVLGIGGGMLMTLLTVWIAGRRLAVLKRDRPRGYHVLWVRLWLAQRGLGQPPVLTRQGVWDIRRTDNLRGLR